jgi:hypothetical protein
MNREASACDATGCAPGDYCSGCWGDMACILRGALC